MNTLKNQIESTDEHKLDDLEMDIDNSSTLD